MKKFIKRLLLIVFLILIVIGAYLYYSLIYVKTTEPKTKLNETSTKASIHSTKQIVNIMKKYPAIFTKEKMEQLSKEKEYGTYAIPGMKATKTVNAVKEITMCTSMTPQGLAVTDKYMFISAYCHTHNHHSVIYVMDKKTHKYLKEIILPDKSHVGGLAFDYKNNYLWISGSNAGLSYANSYSMKTIEDYLNEKEESHILKYDFKMPIYYITRDSFMNYEEDNLIIGYFTTEKISVVEKFPINNDTGNLEVEELDEEENKILKPNTDKIAVPTKFGIIPGEVQGISIINDNYIAITQSYGSGNSKLKVYKYDINQKKNFDFTNKKAYKTYELPNKLEQITVYDGKMYFLFEAGAYAYRYSYNTNVDHILSVDLDK